MARDWRLPVTQMYIVRCADCRQSTSTWHSEDQARTEARKLGFSVRERPKDRSIGRYPVALCPQCAQAHDAAAPTRKP